MSSKGTRNEQREAPRATKATRVADLTTKRSVKAAEKPSRSAVNERKQLLLRLDPKVHSSIANWAADDFRSVNAQIEIILREALIKAGRDPQPGPMRGRGRPSKTEK